MKKYEVTKEHPEIEDPEFTKSDMIELLEHIHKSNDRHNEIEPEDFINEWIKEYKK